MALLEIRDLKKSYPDPQLGSVPVLSVSSFTLDPGEFMALASPSGTGKTTFLNLIAGILTPDSGSILLDGHQLVGLPESKRDQVRASKLGYIFQTFNLLQGFTCLENVLLGMAFGTRQKPGSSATPDAATSTTAKESSTALSSRQKAIQILQRVGLGDRLHHFPRQLSTGQQQRVAVARALANEPRLVLADEPTGNLDPVHAKASLDLIRETCREHGAALLLVSHDPEILRSFDQVQSLSELNTVQRAASTHPTQAEGASHFST
jgi:putative ABC transport system ATP-binding protein